MGTTTANQLLYSVHSVGCHSSANGSPRFHSGEGRGSALCVVHLSLFNVEWLGRYADLWLCLGIMESKGNTQSRDPETQHYKNSVATAGWHYRSSDTAAD